MVPASMLATPPCGSHPDDSAALTSKQRTEKEKAILASMLTAERLEELLVMETGAIRRENADPRAVLGIDGPAPKEE